MAVKLVDGLQMVEHLAGRCLKSFEANRVVQVNPLELPLPMGLVNFKLVHLYFTKDRASDPQQRRLKFFFFFFFFSITILQ